jgi:hypothetical protein
MIPCKDCLVLAACRHKEKIECNEIYDWIDDYRDVAGEVTDYLPNWLTIKGNIK